MDKSPGSRPEKETGGTKSLDFWLSWSNAGLDSGFTVP
jgi:hypothetical protein